MFTTIDVVVLVRPVRAQTVCLVQGQTEQSEIQRESPKGSIFGRLFFIVFMTDVPMSTRTISNVDDSTTITYGKNVQEIELKLNQDLHEISNWCDDNRMVVNVEKIRS